MLEIWHMITFLTTHLTNYLKVVNSNQQICSLTPQIMILHDTESYCLHATKRWWLKCLSASRPPIKFLKNSWYNSFRLGDVSLRSKIRKKLKKCINTLLLCGICFELDSIRTNFFKSFQIIAVGARVLTLPGPFISFNFKTAELQLSTHKDFFSTRFQLKSN